MHSNNLAVPLQNMNSTSMSMGSSGDHAKKHKDVMFQASMLVEQMKSSGELPDPSKSPTELSNFLPDPATVIPQLTNRVNLLQSTVDNMEARTQNLLDSMQRDLDKGFDSV